MDALYSSSTHTHTYYTPSLPASDSSESICKCAISLENNVQTRRSVMSSKAALGKCLNFIKEKFHFAIIATFTVGQLRGRSNPEWKYWLFCVLLEMCDVRKIACFFCSIVGCNNNKEAGVTATKIEMKPIPMCTTLDRGHLGLFCTWNGWVNVIH